VRPGEIVAAAMALFAEKGFSATRLDGVARNSGVVEGTVYLYFENQEGLFRAVAQAALQAHMAHSQSGEPDIADLPISEAYRYCSYSSRGCSRAAILQLLVAWS